MSESPVVVIQPGSVPASTFKDGSPTVGSVAMQFEADPKAPNAITPLNVAPPKKMEYVGCNGSTVFRYPPSHPAMEEIYGKRKYPRNEQVGRVAVLEKQLADEQDKRSAIEKKVDYLTEILAKGGVNAPAEEVVAYKDMLFPELKTTAKERGINTYKMSKNDIIDALTENDG